MHYPLAIVQRFEIYGPRSYIFECLWYWAPMSIVHFTFFTIGVLVIGVVSFFQRRHFWCRTRRWGLFNLCLFVTSGLVNGFWSCLIFGQLYWSTDYVVDFTPFWPITQSVIDAPFGDQVGRLLGVTLLQLQTRWLFFAICAWASGYGLYWFSLRFRPSHGSPSASNQTMER